MNRTFWILTASFCSALFPTLSAAPEVTLSSHVVDDNARSVLMEIRDASSQVIDEVRLELPRNSADAAVLSTSPKDWKLERDGHSIKLSGPAARPPLKFRVTLFDLGTLDRVRTRVRSQGKELLDARVTATELPRVQLVTNPRDCWNFRR
jgi:hypothetical protein